MSPQALAPLLRVAHPILATTPLTLFLTVLVVFALLQLYRLIETTRERKQRFWLTVPEGPACHSRDGMTEQGGSRGQRPLAAFPPLLFFILAHGMVALAFRVILFPPSYTCL